MGGAVRSLVRVVGSNLIAIGSLLVTGVRERWIALQRVRIGDVTTIVREPTRPGAMTTSAGRSRSRQPDGEGGTLSGSVTGGGHGPALRVDQGSADGQADA